jgi:hypothetical protein
MSFIKCEKYPACSFTECECHFKSLIDKRLIELNVRSCKLTTEFNEKIEQNFQKFIDKKFNNND